MLCVAQLDYFLGALEFGFGVWRVVQEDCSFLSLKVFAQARARFATVRLLDHVCEVPGF